MDGEGRLLRLYRRLDGASARSLMDFAEFLTTRAAATEPAPAPESQPLPRPATESVPLAIKRLTRSYPVLARHALMPQVEHLLAQHMVDGRPAPEVIDELEALYAAAMKGEKD